MQKSIEPELLNELFEKVLQDDNFVRAVADLLGYSFHEAYELLSMYNNIPDFPINSNIHEHLENFTEEHLKVLKAVSTVFASLFLKALKIDLRDQNTKETPYRLAKMFSSENLHDVTELLSGRWAREPSITVFTNNVTQNTPIVVTVSLHAVCSHHLVHFGSNGKNGNSYALIAYIPTTKYIGLSKISRWVNWVARRGWMQEELTRYLAENLREKLNARAVYVKLQNIEHGCMSHRGRIDEKSHTTTEHFAFYNNILPEERAQIMNIVYKAIENVH